MGCYAPLFNRDLSRDNKDLSRNNRDLSRNKWWQLSRDIIRIYRAINSNEDLWFVNGPSEPPYNPAGGELTIVNEACQHSVTTVKYNYSLMINYSKLPSGTPANPFTRTLKGKRKKKQSQFNKNYISYKCTALKSKKEEEELRRRVILYVQNWMFRSMQSLKAN